jgi:hypothetical protein
MRKIIFFLTVVMMSMPVWGGFPSDVTIMPENEIHDLSDEKVIDIYMDVLVEIEAQQTFHTTSGFTPKDYKEYKDLLRFRLDLLSEIYKRKLEIPQFDRFSN